MVFIVLPLPGARLPGGEVRHPADRAIARAADWLLSQQAGDGSFGSSLEMGPPRVALSAMALWALAESRSLEGRREAGVSAARYLLKFRQENGGIYDPREGLAIYTSAVANRALDSWNRIQPSREQRAALEAANLFVYRGGVPESYRDLTVRPPSPKVSQTADRLLQRRDELSKPVQRALEFLKTAQASRKIERPHRISVGEGSDPRDDAFSYDELLRFIYELARRDNPSVYKAYNAIRASYTLECNPDLTRRYGPEGFKNSKSGLFYYYLTVARTMWALRRPILQTRDGRSHHWARELTDKLAMLQSREGNWVNTDGRWWEDEPVLATSFAILTLDLCRRMAREQKESEEKR